MKDEFGRLALLGAGAQTKPINGLVRSLKPLGEHVSTLKPLDEHVRTLKPLGDDISSSSSNSSKSDRVHCL